jgi:glucose-6-phosphate isomerase
MPMVLGLLGVWNSTFLGFGSRALLPYSQALLRFPAHIQQVDMESNGKRVTVDGDILPFAAGEVGFGEPGTNGQHSFYQLIHQGRVVPCDFIGFCESQSPIDMKGEAVSNHDELMSNFFAQPDALARGKTAEELVDEGVPAELVPHKTFDGNRPSTSLLFPQLNAFSVGQLLALYEHRTAVQGFLWNVASFDQWGVELGKVLAKQVRTTLATARHRMAATDGKLDPAVVDSESFVSPTKLLLKAYLRHHNAEDTA